MASVRMKGGSPYWFACYTLPDGRRTQRSTKYRIDGGRAEKAKAEATAKTLAKQSELGRRGMMTEAATRQLMADLFKTVNPEPLPSAVAKEFLLEWPEARKAELSPRTYVGYRDVARAFVRSLGEKGSRDISAITRNDIAAYRDAVAKGSSVSNSTRCLKYLRVAFRLAQKLGYRLDNPARDTDALKNKARNIRRRRPFTQSELLKVMGVADGEWRNIIRLGYYTGQRLNDLTRLTWANIDVQRGEIHFVTGKTNLEMRKRIPRPIFDRVIAEIHGGDSPDAPLFPKSYLIASKERPDSRLSQQFRNILAKVGLAEKVSHKATDKGHKGPRKVSELSFHSLRHTTTTRLKEAGVTESQAMAIVGHETEAINRTYTKISAEVEVAALEKLPDIG